MSGEIGVPLAPPSMVAVIVWAEASPARTVAASNGAKSARSSRRSIRQRCEGRADVSIAPPILRRLRPASTLFEIPSTTPAGGRMRTIAPLFALLLSLSTVAGTQQPARRDPAPVA